MKVNNKEYVVEENELTINLLENKEMVAYGYSIEMKFRENSSWSTYWTNKIYGSLNSALNAIKQIPKGSQEEFRIVSLYKMSNSDIREYKIKQVLGDVKTKEDKLSQVKAWKAKKDFEYPKGQINKMGSVFIEFNKSVVKSGQTEKTKYFWNSDIRNHLTNKDIFEKIELKDEKWLYPHLLKELKKKYEEI